MYHYYNIAILLIIVGGEDFIPGRYNVTFTTGANAANTSIPIIVNGTNDNEIEQFGLNLYIDGIGYQLCLDKGYISEATASISCKVSAISMYCVNLLLAIIYICTVV